MWYYIDKKKRRITSKINCHIDQKISKLQYNIDENLENCLKLQYNIERKAGNYFKNRNIILKKSKTATKIRYHINQKKS